MDFESYLKQIERNWKYREDNCANCPKWHTGGFKKPFFGASPQGSLEADVVFAGIEPGTGGNQRHEDWREEEEISLEEAADRIGRTEDEFSNFPKDNAAMFSEELLKIAIGEQQLGNSANTKTLNYYITNLEKCHAAYGYQDSDSDKYDESKYKGDVVYDSECDTDMSAIDCCISYFRKELKYLEPDVVVGLGTDACNHFRSQFSGFSTMPKLTRDPFVVLESDDVEWKLIPAMHPSDENLHRANSFSDVELPGRKTPTDDKEARRVYLDMLHDLLVRELNS